MFGVTITRLLYLGAMVALGLGVLYSILNVAGLDGVSGSIRAGQFFYNLMITAFIAGVLLALSELVARKQ
jgi:hypothetical protein